MYVAHPLLKKGNSSHDASLETYVPEIVVAPTLNAGSNMHGGTRPPGTTPDTADNLLVARGVRRLTPRECERLQGFPDDYTAVPYKGKPAADGPRYRAIGNSMAIPVMRWLGERIQKVVELSHES